MCFIFFFSTKEKKRFLKAFVVSYRNVQEHLGKLEKVVETLDSDCICSHSISLSVKQTYIPLSIITI